MKKFITAATILSTVLSASIYGQETETKSIAEIDSIIVTRTQEMAVYTVFAKSSSGYNKLSEYLDDVWFYPSLPNSAGGVNFFFSAKNKSEQTIKYVHYKVAFKNRVDDYVTDDITDAITFRLKETGPIQSGYSVGGEWENVIYNSTAAVPVLKSLVIDYMNGDSVTIELTEEEQNKVSEYCYKKYTWKKEIDMYIAMRKMFESLADISERLDKVSASIEAKSKRKHRR